MLNRMLLIVVTLWVPYLFAQDSMNHNSLMSDLIDSAHKGDVKAQVQLGNKYYLGSKTDYDPKKAIAWYKKAGLLGSPEALTRLGDLHAKGIGTPQDFEKAFQYYESAAMKGYSEAQMRLAFFHENGIGTSKNLKKASDWYHKAALCGNAKAQYKLAIAFVEGRGVKKDLGKAVAWFEHASSLGSKMSELLKKKVESKVSSQELAKSRMLVNSELNKHQHHLVLGEEVNANRE